MAKDTLGQLFPDVKPSDVQFEGLSEEENRDIQEKIKIMSELVNADRSKSGSEDSINVLKMVAFKVAGPIFTLLSKVVPIQPASISLLIVGSVLSNCGDALSDSINKLKEELDACLLRKCIAMSQKLKTSFRYLSGLPDPKNLDDDKRTLYITRMAADVPVFTGYDEIAELRVDIEIMIKMSKSVKMPELINKVEFYCCLTTYFELFLLFRLSIENAYGVDNKSIFNVLQEHLEKDQQLLSFLFKPTVDTIKLFLRFIPNKCPLVAQFLEGRNMRNDIGDFINEKVKIFSLPYPNSCLSAHHLIIFTCLRCHKETMGNHTEFLMKNTSGDNVFTLHPSDRPHYTVYTCLWVRMCENPKQDLCEWRIVKVEPTAKENKAFYLLFLHSSGGTKCMYTDSTGRIYVGKYSEGDSNCKWTIETVPGKKMDK